jgi:hypothetical protein
MAGKYDQFLSPHIIVLKFQHWSHVWRRKFKLYAAEICILVGERKADKLANILAA